MAIDFDGIARTVLARARELLPRWFPAGHFEGNEFCIGNVAGEPGDSLKFNVVKGYGTDFATGQKFGDIIDLYAQHFGMSLGDASKELASDNGVGYRREGVTPAPSARREEPREELELPPDGADCSLERFLHRERGLPSVVHPYRTSDGRLMFVTARYEVDEARGVLQKAVLPWVWSGDSWICRGPPKPRPLYGLDSLAMWPDAAVMIVEGEKVVDAARLVAFPKNPVVSWMNGAKGVDSADWTWLSGVKRAVIWPDADAPGHEAMSAVAGKLLALGIAVDFIDLSGESLPEGWDIADAVAAGWDMAAIQAWGKARRKPWPQTPQAVAEAPPPENPATPPQDEPEERPPASRTELWERLGLARKGNGNPYTSVDNALAILSHAVPAKVLHYDPFLNRIQIREQGAKAHTNLRDDHILNLQLMMQRTYGMQDMGKGTVADALVLLSRKRQRNSLQEWIRRQEWDGKERVDGLFVRGFGAEDTPYHRAVARSFVCGMVARAMRPGCQLDTMPILEGEQGIGKSRGLAALGGDWYADIDSAIGSKEFCEQIQGSWLVELSELSAMRPSEVERVKSGISRTVDKYREPFALLSSDHPRQCVFCGTTNADTYLQDDTGNRRFYPVKCGKIDREWIAEHRGQLFAEALKIFETTATWHEVPVDAARAAVESRLIGDTLADAVADYCKGQFGDVVIANMLTYWDIPRSQWSPQIQRRICAALRGLGYGKAHTARGNVWRRLDAMIEEAGGVPSGNVSSIRRARKLGG
jgi:putative DNA primase/helicase